MMPSRILLPAFALLTLLATSGQTQSSDLVQVVARPASQTIELPGELLPFLTVSLHAKVQSYVERVLVDRGSVVKEGELMVQLSAPEIEAQIAEAESKVQAHEADRLQAESQLAAAQSTYDRLKAASQTTGAIAGNELIQAEKLRDAARALVSSRQQAIQSASAAVKAIRDLQAYLKITAPFSGIITDRLVHPGALVGPGNDVVLLVLQQISRLRLVIPVPEENISGIVNGAVVSFHVPAWPGRVFSGKAARIAHALDQRTRTMPIELDVVNADGLLSPGMYPSVKWPVHRATASLFVPRTSVVTTTERTFIIRDRNGQAEWVDVRKGATEGDMVEVLGNLKPGDAVLRRATDEIREGTSIIKR